MLLLFSRMTGSPLIDWLIANLIADFPSFPSFFVLHTIHTVCNIAYRTLDRLADSFDDQGRGDADADGAAGGGIAAAGGQDPSTRQRGRFYTDDGQ